MSSNKVLLAVLVCFSLSTADISGIVTDTGSNPLAQASVQLEHSGQKVTTGSDGRFTLKVATSVTPHAGILLLNGFSGRITGTGLNLTVAHRCDVTITTFNLAGKVLSIMRTTLDAGSHTPLTALGVSPFFSAIFL